MTAAGVHWTAVPGSQQSVSYSWEACTTRRCAALSVPVHQPYLPSALLGPGDVGKDLRVSETAVDVLASGKETHATVSYRSKRAVAAWPRGVSPRIDFVYGVPESESASTRELFDLSPPFANRADGRVTVACAIDRGRYSRACGHSRSFMTTNLSRGRHTVRVSEQCFGFRECTARQNDGITFFPRMRCNMTSLRCGVGQFAAAGKWVGEVEYKWGVPHEDGVVCDPGQHCILRSHRGNYSEVPYKYICATVYRGYRFAAWRPYESDAIDGHASYYCWLHYRQFGAAHARPRRGRMRPRGPATCGRAIESGRVQPGPPERPRHVVPSPGARRGTHARRRVRGVRRAATRLRRAA